MSTPSPSAILAFWMRTAAPIHNPMPLRNLILPAGRIIGRDLSDSELEEAAGNAGLSLWWSGPLRMCQRARSEVRS